MERVINTKPIRSECILGYTGSLSKIGWLTPSSLHGQRPDLQLFLTLEDDTTRSYGWRYTFLVNRTTFFLRSSSSTVDPSFWFTASWFLVWNHTRQNRKIWLIKGTTDVGDNESVTVLLKGLLQVRVKTLPYFTSIIR